MGMGRDQHAWAAPGRGLAPGVGGLVWLAALLTRSRRPSLNDVVGEPQAPRARQSMGRVHVTATGWLGLGNVRSLQRCGAMVRVLAGTQAAR